MARGVMLSLQIRQQIKRKFDLGMSPMQIYNDLNSVRFDGKKLKNKYELVSIHHLKKMARFFRTASNRMIDFYLNVMGKSSGRPATLDTHELDMLEKVNDFDDSAPYEQLVEDMRNICGKTVSIATICRSLRKIGIKRKCYTLEPGQADLQQQIDHLKQLRHLPHRRFINVDESHDGGGSKAASKKGRARKRALKKQFIIEGKRRTYMAAVSSRGLHTYARFDNNCTSDQFINFVEKYLAPVVDRDHNTVLYDNASTHLTDAALTAMHMATGGNHKRVPAYCHWLSPVERFFSLVWARVRRHKRRLDGDGIPGLTQVDMAFEYFMVGQPGACKCKNLFNLYKRNHKQYKYDKRQALLKGIPFE